MILDTRPDERGATGQHGGGTVEGVVRENRTHDVLVAKLVAEMPQGK